MTPRAAVGTLAFAALAGCGGNTTGPTNPPPPPSNVGSVTLSPMSITDLQIGDTVRLHAEVRDRSGNPMTGQAVAWSSSNPLVATVSNTGLVTGVGGGNALVTASSGGRQAQTTVMGVPWRIAENAVVVDSTVLRLLSDSTEQANGTLRLEVQAGRTAPVIEPGDILVGAQGVGFLWRVESVAQAGNVITTTISDATLVEVLPYGSFQSVATLGTGAAGSLLPAQGPVLTPAPGGKVVLDLEPGVQLTSSGVSFKGDLCEGGAIQCPVGLKGKLILPEANIDFNPSFDVGGTINDGQVVEFHAIGSGTLTLTADANLGATGAVSFTGSRSLLTITRPVLIQVGLLPIPSLLKFQLKLGFTVTVSDSVAFTMKISGSATSQLGARYTQAGGWQEVSDVSINGSASEPSLGGKVKTALKVWLTPALSLIAYGVAGPFVQWGPFGEASANISAGPSPGTSSCSLKTKAGLDGKVGIQLAKLAASVASWSTALPEVVIYEEDYPCPFGSVAVQVSTTGANPDPDGYTLAVGAQSQTVGANGSFLFEDLIAGQHQVSLTGVANQCSVQANPQQVDVTAGQTATTSFSVQCGTDTGTLVVQTATTGGDDPDGYGVVVDGARSAVVAANGSVTFDDLATGSHSVLLNGIAGNCDVNGVNPRMVNLATGQSASVTFDVACVTTELTVRVTTTGDQLDPNGYTVSVDQGAQSQNITINGTTVFGGLGLGNHIVELTGVAPNCSVLGGTTQDVDLVAAGTEAMFTVTCASGGLVVDVSTQGDPGVTDYVVAVDDDQTQPVGINGTVQFASLPAGQHLVELRGVPNACGVTGLNPRSVDIPASITFAVTCTGAQAGEIFYMDLPGRIFAVNPDGTNRRQILEGINGQSKDGVAVSRDGTRIAFLDLSFTQPNEQLWVANADGTGRRLLLEANPLGQVLRGILIGDGAWSPDGTRLVARLETCGTHLTNPNLTACVSGVAIVDVSNGAYTVLPNTWGNCIGIPAWSPDGASIATRCYSADQMKPWVDENGHPANGPLAIIDVAGGALRLLDAEWPFSLRECRSPSWSPDGTQITCFADGGLGIGNQILVINVDTGLPTAFSTSGTEPAWSPDGNWIAFVADADPGPLTQHDLFLIHPDGTGRVNITQSSRLEWGPAWGPAPTSP